MWGLVFPGQGSQSVGMGRFLFDEFSYVRHLFEEASDITKVSFKEIIFDGPMDILSQTVHTQPALVLVETCYWQVFQKEFGGHTISAAAGHSLGEYSALVSGGSFSFSGAILAVHKRGQYMQDAVPVGQGGMVALIGLTEDWVKKICFHVSSLTKRVLEPANYNSSDQIVVSGDQVAIKALMELDLADLDIPSGMRLRRIPLPVSAPFHCSLMKPAQEKMKPILESMSFEQPSFSVVQNSTAEVPLDTILLRQALIEQISKPVLWTQSIEKIRSMGVTHWIEMGPGRILTSLLKKLDSQASCFNIQNLDDFKALQKVKI